MKAKRKTGENCSANLKNDKILPVAFAVIFFCFSVLFLKDDCLVIEKYCNYL